MIEIKSYFGGWHTVEREHAERFVRGLINGGCVRREIANHLRGISVDDLLCKLEITQAFIPIIERPAIVPMQEVKQANENELEIKDCVVELELLARKEAFCRFEQNVLFSLTVWQNDEKIREQLPSVIEWVRECADILNGIVSSAQDGAEYD